MQSPKAADVDLRQRVRGEVPRFFKAEGVDELVSVVLAMAAELWVVKGRLASLESLADKTGLLTAEQIEGHELSAEQRAAFEAERAAYLERLFITFRERSEGLADTIAETLKPPALD